MKYMYFMGVRTGLQILNEDTRFPSNNIYGRIAQHPNWTTETLLWDCIEPIFKYIKNRPHKTFYTSTLELTILSTAQPKQLLCIAIPGQAV